MTFSILEMVVCYIISVGVTAFINTATSLLRWDGEALILGYFACLIPGINVLYAVWEIFCCIVLAIRGKL